MTEYKDMTFRGYMEHCAKKTIDLANRHAVAQRASRDADQLMRTMAPLGMADTKLPDNFDQILTAMKVVRGETEMAGDEHGKTSELSKLVKQIEEDDRVWGEED